MEKISSKTIAIVAFANDAKNLQFIEFINKSDLEYFVESLQNEDRPYVLARDFEVGGHVQCLGEVNEHE